MAIFGNKEPKEKQAIAELQEKKEMLTTAVKTEIANYNAKIILEYRKIGQNVFENYKGNNMNSQYTNEEFINIFNQIDIYNNAIVEEQARLDEICNRYDDEINILHKSLGEAQMKNCPNCGKQYVPGNSKFCGGCGNGLS